MNHHCGCHFIIPHTLMMASVGDKSSWETYGTFLNSFHPKVKWLIQILDRIGRHKMSVLFNQTCLKEIIIIMSCRLHGYPWPSLSTSPYRSSPPAGLHSYIPYPYITAVCMFELVVLLLLGHMWGSIRVHHLWARLCFSSSVLHIWFI